MKKAPLIPTEQEEQEALIRWCDNHPDRRISLIYSHLNGLRASIGAVMKAKKAGARKGIPDLFLPVPYGQYHGLYIEMKRIKGGKLYPEQKEWLKDLSDLGYMAVICKGHEESIAVILEYLKIPTN